MDRDSDMAASITSGSFKGSYRAPLKAFRVLIQGGFRVDPHKNCMRVTSGLPNQPRRPGLKNLL